MKIYRSGAFRHGACLSVSDLGGSAGPFFDLDDEDDSLDSDDSVDDAAAAAIGKRFGHGAVEGKIQAHIVIAQR